MILVKYSANNSGGRDWLTDEDWVALYDAGWQLRKDYGDCVYTDAGGDVETNWELDPRTGSIGRSSRKEFSSMREAVNEWENLTSGNASDEGCNCCGPPHNFSGKDLETGEYVDGPEIVTDSYLQW